MKGFLSDGGVYQPRGPSLAFVSSRVDESLFKVARSYAHYADTVTLEHRVACTVIAFVYFPNQIMQKRQVRLQGGSGEE